MPTLPQTGAPHKLAEGDWAAALEADMQVVVRRAIEHIVDAELTALLGPRYAWDAARVGYRHGSKVRTITSPVGAVTLTVPRARLQTGAGTTEWLSFAKTLSGGQLLTRTQDPPCTARMDR